MSAPRGLPAPVFSTAPEDVALLNESTLELVAFYCQINTISAHGGKKENLHAWFEESDTFDSVDSVALLEASRSLDDFGHLDVGTSPTVCRSADQ